MPILGIFSPKTILIFRVGLGKIRVGRPTGTTHTFHLSLIQHLLFVYDVLFEDQFEVLIFFLLSLVLNKISP